MKVSELGEFGLIELLASIVDKHKNAKDASWQSLIIGIGDDAAAWQGDNATQLATTDTLVQDVHFNLNTISWEELGWKALAINLSDIAAMGGVPKYALVSLSLPGKLEVECLSSLYQGMVELATEFGIAIVGGDVVSAPKVVITVTVLGRTEDKGKNVLRRSAAIPGDKVAVTGYLGSSAAGLRMLSQKLDFDNETAKLLRQAHCHPIPRVREGQVLLRQGVKAAIDISDGLLADLAQICKLSKVGARIRSGWLPIHPLVQAAFKTESLELALSGGEDYELLFTADSEVVERVRQTLNCPVTVIGEIVKEKPGQVSLIDNTGNITPWHRRGWEHFRSQPLEHQK